MENKKAFWSLWLGFIIFIIGFVALFIALGGRSSIQPLAFLGLTIEIIGAVLFVFGSCMLAERKGYNWEWGLFGFLGLLFPLGLLTLVYFNDKNKESENEGGNVRLVVNLAIGLISIILVVFFFLAFSVPIEMSMGMFVASIGAMVIGPVLALIIGCVVIWHFTRKKGIKGLFMGILILLVLVLSMAMGFFVSSVCGYSIRSLFFK